MKMIVFGTALGFIMATSMLLDAVLPPLYESSREIQKILQSEELGQLLPSGEPIIEIRKTDKGYEIITSQHQIQAIIVYLPQKYPGPSHFDVKFEQAEPKK